jgi:hypothetical protein
VLSEDFICNLNQQAFVYRLDETITQYPATAILSGEDVVPRFTLPLKSLL